MIDEKKLIEEIKYLLFNSEILSPRWFAINEVLEKIKRHPKTGEWIPCSERLPEELVAVNITWVNRNPPSYYIHIKDKPFTGTGIFYRGKWYWESPLTKDVLKEYGEYSDYSVNKDIDITAWMPLPESYACEIENVTKLKFRLEDYQENYVMHCNTEEKAKIFCNFLHDAGRIWDSGALYNQSTLWEVYKEKTVYYFNEDMFADVEDAIDFDYQVLEFDDFDWE